MKKSNFFVSIILIVVLCLTGCGKVKQSSASDGAALPESLRKLSFDKHLDISVGFWDIDDMIKEKKPDGMLSYIEKLFNITIKPVSVSWSNYKERYQILSATNNLPDIFASITISSNNTEDSAMLSDMIDKGSIRSLPANLSDFPTLKKYMDSLSYTKHSDNRYYAIPRISYTGTKQGSTDAAMLVRKDWMSKLHIDTPDSFDDFAHMVTAFATDDPDGNGKNDTIGYNVNTLSALGKWVILGIAPSCNTFSWVLDSDKGYYVPSWTTKEFQDVVASYRRLYQMGGLDPNFYSKTTETVTEDFASGKLGAFEFKSSPDSLLTLKSKWDKYNTKKFEDCVAILPIFAAPNGTKYSNSSNMYWSESYISSNADSDKMTRILALMEFLLSEQGQTLCHFGIENADYCIDANGTYKSLLDVTDRNYSTALLEKYPSLTLFSTLASWGVSSADYEKNSKNEMRCGKDITEITADAFEWTKKNTTQLKRPYAFLNYPKEPSEYFGTTQVQDAFVSCIIGDEDPIKMWNDTLSDMKQKGLEDYILRQNKSYEESRIAE